MKILETLKFIGRIRSNKNRQRGFTLIELVVVLAVLGILAAIAIPQLTGLQDEAELSGNAANISSEVSNQFARDFATGLASDDTGTSGIDWTVSEVCGSIEEEHEDDDTIVPSLDAGGAYDIVDKEPGDDPSVAISVPAIDTTDSEISEDECFVTAE